MPAITAIGDVGHISVAIAGAAIASAGARRRAWPCRSPKRPAHQRLTAAVTACASKPAAARFPEIPPASGRKRNDDARRHGASGKDERQTQLPGASNSIQERRLFRISSRLRDRQLRTFPCRAGQPREHRQWDERGDGGERDDDRTADVPGEPDSQRQRHDRRHGGHEPEDPESLPAPLRRHQLGGQSAPRTTVPRPNPKPRTELTATIIPRELPE